MAIRTGTALGAVALLLAGAGADAQEVAQPQDSVLRLAPVDSVLRLAPLQARALLGDVARTPGAAAILSQAAIRQLLPYSLHDVLDHIAGVRTIDDDVLGRRSGIGIRGAPPRRSRKTLLLEDGSPINSSTYLDPSAHYTPPLERLERVEVLKGAGQIVHGPLNNHGIINFRNHRAGPQPRTRAELAVGGMGTFRRHALHSRTTGGAGVVIAYTGMNAAGAFDVERHQFDDLFASVVVSPHRGHTVETSLTLFRERSAGYDEANLTPEQFGLHPRSKLILDEGREFNRIAVDYLKADAVHGARIGGANIATRLFVTELDRPRFQTRGAAPADGGVMEGRDRLYRTLGVESRVEAGTRRVLGVDQRLQAGVRYERHSFYYGRPVGRPGERLDEGSRGNVRARDGVNGYTRDGRLVTYAAEAYSTFLQSSVAAGPVTLTPGVRIESYEQSRHVDYWPGSADEGTRQRDRHTLLLPGIGLLYPLATAELYAGVHRGFAPATARTEEFPLLPETGSNAQLGVRAALSARVSFDVALFHNRIADTLIRDDVDVFGEALFVNTASSRVTGIDVTLRAVSAPDAAAARVFADVAYNATRAHFAGGPLHGNHVPEVPVHAGSLTAGFEQMGRWRVNATVSHFGAFYADKENTEELREDGGRVPDHTLISARASVTLGAGASLWLQGRNLADRLYISDVQDGLRPGAPRTIVAGLSIGF
jgi:Fe(3+) dicitrate transport protein